MKKVPDDFIINLAFRESIDREELLIRKYDEYLNTVKTDEIKDMLRQFTKYSQEHLKIIKDKVVHLNLQD